jgi:hypothetical protein
VAEEPSGPAAPLPPRRARSGRHPSHVPNRPSRPHPVREAKALHDGYIGAEHLTLALVAMNEGAVPPILSALGAPQATLRAAILDRYPRAS